MLYFFYGTDSKKAGEKANSLVEKMLEKKPNASLFVVDENNCNENTLQEMTQSSALFENKYIVRVKRVLQREARSDPTSLKLRGAGKREETILDFLKEIKESENIFIWNEGEVSKTDLKKIEKFAEKIVDVGGKKEETKIQSNKIFEICNPLINRDKKNAWVKYQELLELFAPEELHGTIFWQFKNIAIASKASQKDSGLNSFPYQNAKKALQKYSNEEVLEKTNELSKIVHESRVGGPNLSVALERFVLNI